MWRYGKKFGNRWFNPCVPKFLHIDMQYIFDIIKSIGFDFSPSVSRLLIIKAA